MADVHDDEKGTEKPKKKGRQLIGLWRPPLGMTPGELDEWARAAAEEFVDRVRERREAREDSEES